MSDTSDAAGAVNAVGMEVAVDTEVATQRGTARPVHMQWRYLTLVFFGGALGTAVREVLGQLIPPGSGFPLATFSVNICGAFALGVLLTMLSQSGAGLEKRRAARVFWATGVLGGFTTYSGLATDTAQLFGLGNGNSNPTLALLYALGTVLIGIVASWLGVWCGSRIAARGKQ